MQYGDNNTGENGGLRVNLAEAALSDYGAGFFHNALTSGYLMSWTEINQPVGEWFFGPVVPAHGKILSETLYKHISRHGSAARTRRGAAKWLKTNRHDHSADIMAYFY